MFGKNFVMSYVLLGTKLKTYLCLSFKNKAFGIWSIKMIKSIIS